MTTTLAGVSGDDILFKAVRNATINIEKAEGVVEAFAAAIGNKDSVGDIIIPGAFDSSLSRRKPRVVWGHNWNEPIGKVLDIEEVPPTDSRLPQKMKNALVGGLYVKVQFNLNSERGREAFASVMFFGEDQEWSIGYKTIKADFDPTRGANMLKEVELYEVSPVLHGANNLTGTISVKDGRDGAVAIFDDEGLTYDEAVAEEKAEEEPEEKGMMAGLLARAVSGVFGPSARLRHMEGNKLVFERGADGMYMTTFVVDGPRVTFTPPKPARIRRVIEPMPEQMERKPHHGEPRPDMDRYKGNDGEEGKSDSFTFDMTGTTSVGNIWISEGNDTTISDGTFTYTTSEPYELKFYVDGEEVDEKAGRVLRSSNMGKLRQALTLLQEVLQSGERPEAEEGVMAKSEFREAAEDIKELVIGQPETLVGVSVDIPVDTIDDTEEIVLALEQPIQEFDLAVVAPGEKAFDDGPSKVSVYLSSSENIRDQIDLLATALSDVKGDFSVSIDKKDFFGETKQFEEVFSDVKVLS